MEEEYKPMSFDYENWKKNQSSFHSIKSTGRYRLAYRKGDYILQREMMEENGFEPYKIYWEDIETEIVEE